jgi:hypothetical protein
VEQDYSRFSSAGAHIDSKNSRFPFQQGDEFSFRDAGFGARAFEVCQGLVECLGG